MASAHVGGTHRARVTCVKAARISDITAFFYMGKLIEAGKTDIMFTKPNLKETEDYITGRFG